MEEIKYKEVNKQGKTQKDTEMGWAENWGRINKELCQRKQERREFLKEMSNKECSEVLGM